MIKATGIIRLAIYDNVHYCFINSDSKTEVNKYLKEQKIDLKIEESPYATTYCTKYAVNKKSTNMIVVCIFDTSIEDDKITVGTVAHESLHFMHFVFEHIHQELLYNHESQNYLLGWFTDIITTFLYGKDNTDTEKL